jgi:HEAT repeat protein
MRHVFISYCHDDADFAQILKEQINNAGFVTWKDLDLRAGDNWRSEIDDAIKAALAVILVISPPATASGYVSFEWAFALGAGVPVLPIVLKPGPAGLHPRLNALQTLDFSNYALRPWDVLTRSLKEIAEADRPFTVSAPRDAPPVIQQAAHSLDSLNANERNAAIQTLAQMNHPAARDVLAEALEHPVEDVRAAAAVALAKFKDLRAIPGLLEALRNKRFKEVNSQVLCDFGETGAPAFINALRDPNETPDLRGCVAQALGWIGNSAALPALREVSHAADPGLRMSAIRALGSLGDPVVLPWILECLHDEDPGVISVAIDSLKGLDFKKFSGADAIAGLIGVLHHRDPYVRRLAADALAGVGDTTAIPALLEALHDDNKMVRSSSVMALGRLGDATAVPGLLEAIHDDSVFGTTLLDALIGIGGAQVITGLLQALHSEKAHIRRGAASALGDIGDHVSVPGLLEALTDEEESVQEQAATALGKIKDARAVPNLIALLKSDDQDDQVRDAASTALQEIATPEARAAVRAWERQKKRTG